MLSNRIRITGIILIVAHCSQTFVLLTANIEDVKKIARKFVSEPMAQQIADFISKAAGQQVKTNKQQMASNTNLSAENDKNVDNVDNPSDDDINKQPQQGTSRRYRKQSRPTTSIRESKGYYESKALREKPDIRDQSRYYEPTSEPSDVREPRTNYESSRTEATAPREREQNRMYGSTSRTEQSDVRDRGQDRERERETDYRPQKKQAQRPKQRGSMAQSAKDDQYVPVRSEARMVQVPNDQLREHQHLQEQLASLQSQVREAASMTGDQDPIQKPKRIQKQRMPSPQSRPPPKKRAKPYQDEQQYENSQPYNQQYRPQYQNQQNNDERQYRNKNQQYNDERQYRNKNQQYNDERQYRNKNQQEDQYREHKKQSYDNMQYRESKINDNEQNQPYDDPGLKYKEYPDQKEEDTDNRLTRGTYQMDRQIREYKTERPLRQQDDMYEATEESKYLREGEKKDFQIDDRPPMEADRIVSTDIQRENKLPEPKEVEREMENREFGKEILTNPKPAYDQVEYEQTPKRNRNRIRNRERFAFQENNDPTEFTTRFPAFNIDPAELTTEKEKNEFDQYDNIKPQPLVATSGPVALKAADAWWQNSMPLVRSRLVEPPQIQVAPVPPSPPKLNADAPILPGDDKSTMVINLVANAEESTTVSTISPFATGFGKFGNIGNFI